jgi:tetratricopeptide (TPR) repeat protein
MDKVLPNFLIVGAAKSGTTSLFEYLNQHPDIFLPEFKEPQFFVLEDIAGSVYKYIDNWEAYLQLFDGADGCKWRGEASVFYLYYYNTAIRNILKYLGKDVKIIIILRNPIERAFSAYNHTLKNNPDENLNSFEMALNAEEERIKKKKISPMLHYKAMGLYAESIAAFKENFKKVLVLDYKEMIKDPDNLVKKIFDFLEVPQIKVDFGTVHNKGGKVWKSSFLKKITRTGFGQAVIKSIPGSISRKLKKKLFTPITETVSEQVKNSLKDYYQADIEKLVTTEGQFEYWLKK